MESDRNDARKRESLAWLLKRLPKNAGFESWLTQTGELPPDFDALPAQAFPQSPLEGISSVEQWEQRRKELLPLIQHWLLGHAPPAPGNVRAIIEEKGQRDGRECWTVRLEFGPDHAAKLPCWFFPGKGEGPWPTFLSDNSRYIKCGWDAHETGQFALLQYGATDPCYINESPDPSLAFHDLFGPYDWSAFMRRGWCASRAIDWLETLPQIDASRIYIGGHSRSAKQSMAAAIFDDRIAGAILSSPGSGGSFAYRSCDGSSFGEAIELLTQAFPDWVSLRGRFFAVRENKLPVDCHLMYALIAPRPVLMSTGVNDWVENTWAVEQTYKLTRPVYELYGKAENFTLRYREGQHSVDPQTYKAFSEFLRIIAGQMPDQTPASRFPYRPFHPWDYADWSRRTQNSPAAPPQAANTRQTVRQRIEWLLGEGQEYRPVPAKMDAGHTDEQMKLLARNAPNDLQVRRCRFGAGVNAEIYSLAQQTQPRPAIIFLAPLQTSNGYDAKYRSGDFFQHRSARAGFVTFAFDPISTALRQEERREFFDRHPDWSLVGKMVLDVRHAVDALRGMPGVDPGRIYVVGYAIGGIVAMLAAALDERVAAAVSIAGLTPWRSESADSPTGGLAALSHLDGWIPRLGAFIGRENETLVDVDEIIASVAPRPIFVIAPTHDWHADMPALARAVETARRAYAAAGHADALKLLIPDDWNRLTNAREDEAIAWLKDLNATA